MIKLMKRISPQILLLVLLLVVSTNSRGLAGAESVTAFRDAGKITSVTAHRGWASVIRRVEVTLASNEVVLVVTDLPASAIHDSIHAEIVGESADAVTVREIQITQSNRVSYYDARVVLALNEVDADAEAIPVLNSIIALNINYIVTNVDWVPAYSIRADSEEVSVRIGCDIVIGQTTGESWDDVQLTVSSAPGTIPNWDSVFTPQPMGTTKDSAANRNTETDSSTNAPALGNPIQRLDDILGGDGAVFGSREISDIFDWSDSPMVERTLSYPVSVASGTLDMPRTKVVSPGGGSVDTNQPLPSATSRSERVRFRLDEFMVRPPFRYVAAPSISQNAFLVGTVRNTRPHNLLPGPVAIYLDSHYAGEMIMPNLAPGELIDVAFGNEPDLLVHQRETGRSKHKTGLLGDGRETQIDYQIAIQNNTGKPARLEVWDQIPVAQSDEITISVDSLSHPLSKGQEYVDLQRPRGLLRWDLPAPATSRLNAPLTLEYTLVISHHKDVDPAWIPK